MKKKNKKVQSTQKVAVLRSIKPYWLYLILIGKKILEIGKSRPQDENWDGRVFLYCSMDMKSFRRIPKQDQEWMQKYLGKVACMFVCDHIEDYQNMLIVDIKNTSDELTIKPLLDASQLTLDELKDYTANQGPFDCVYAWHIAGMVQHGYPKELNEFHQRGYFAMYEKYRKADDVEGFEKHYEELYQIKRPPQTYCYVEVRDYE